MEVGWGMVSNAPPNLGQTLDFSRQVIAASFRANSIELHTQPTPFMIVRLSYRLTRARLEDTDQAVSRGLTQPYSHRSTMPLTLWFPQAQHGRLDQLRCLPVLARYHPRDTSRW